MSVLARYIPWFIKDLGVSIIGDVSARTLSLFLFGVNIKTGMLHVTGREPRCPRRQMPQILPLKGSRHWNCFWRIYYESSTDTSQ